MAIKVTQAKFDAIKTLLKGGATKKEAAEYMGVSDVTVWYIGKAETLEEYRNMVAEQMLNRKKQGTKKETKPETNPEITNDKQPGGTLSANYQLNRLHEQMKAQTELLKLISEKMAFIVEQLA